MACTSISPAALFAAIEAANIDMMAAEAAADPHEACRHLDLAQAFTSAAARLAAVTEADRAAHRQLSARVAHNLAAHASGLRPLNERDLWRVIEDMEQLAERLAEQQRAQAA